MTSTVEFKCRHKNLFILSQQSCWFENQKQQEKNTSILQCFALRILTLFVDPNFTFFFSTIVCKDLPFIASSRCKYNIVQALFYALTGNTLVQLNDYKQAHGKTRSGTSHLAFWTTKKKQRYFGGRKNWILLFAKRWYQNETESLLFFLFTNRNLHGRVLCTDRHSLLFFVWGRKGIVNSLLSTVIPFATESKSSLMLSTLPALESLMCTKLVKMMLFKKVLKFQKTSFCCRGHF